MTGSSSFCWRECKKSGGQYCPPPPGPDRVKAGMNEVPYPPTLGTLGGGKNIKFMGKSIKLERVEKRRGKKGLGNKYSFFTPFYGV